MNSTEQFSVILSEALDVLGYNRDVVEARRVCYDKISKELTEALRNANVDGHMTISGSKREGLSGCSESDIDLMYTLNDVQCSENPESDTRDADYIFQLDRENCPHGYTKLRLFYKNVNKLKPAIENSLIQYPDGSCYLSSTLFVSEMMVSDPVQQFPFTKPFSWGNNPRSGPSTPHTAENPFSEGSLEWDRVLAFPCQCSDYMQSWINRPRDFDWPSQEQIEKAANLDAHVVPVGAKGSEDAHLQWKVCYTLTEVDLMQSLNETQWKLYVTLKKIRDLVFKPLGDLLTSYVLKNVIMWISESNPIEAFQPKCIFHKLQECLDFLIRGFLSKRIPNYRASDHNLLEGRLDDRNTRDHLAALNEVRRNLPATILRCTKLKDAMVQVYVAPDAARAEMRLNSKKEVSHIYLLATTPRLYDSRFMSCSTLDEAVDVYLQMVSDIPEAFATLHNLPADVSLYLVQLFQVLPPEIQVKLIQYSVNIWRNMNRM